MSEANETADDLPPLRRERALVSGAILVWSNGAPTCRKHAFGERRLDIGRDERCSIDVSHDKAASRRHAEISNDEGGVRVRDLGSHNGTFLNGEKVDGERTVPYPAVLRVGGSVFLLDSDVDRLDGREDLLDGDEVAGAAIKRAWSAAAQAAQHDRSLLIHGETGAGKERVAKLFHQAGPRARGTLVAINCAEIREERAEADLFGHKRAAYTGAVADRAGAFERAHGGTLFFDEVGELSLDVQAKLLRALQERTILPVGGDTPKKVDLGICCATHRDLTAMVAAGRFREDLLRRLVEREVHLPPLRERREEIPFFAEMFRRRIPGAPQLTARFIEACLPRRWRGNVRELQVAVERSAADAVAHGFPLVDFHEELFPTELPDLAPAPPSQHPGREQPQPPPKVEPKQSERSKKVAANDARVDLTVKAFDGNVAAAAEHLGMPVSSVYLAVKRHGERKR